MIMIILIGIVFFTCCNIIALIIISWGKQNSKMHMKQIHELVNKIIKENIYINSSLGILEASGNYQGKSNMMEREHITNQQWDEHDRIYREVLEEIEKRKQAVSDRKFN